MGGKGCVINSKGLTVEERRGGGGQYFEQPYGIFVWATTAGNSPMWATRTKIGEEECVINVCNGRGEKREDGGQYFEQRMSIFCGFTRREEWGGKGVCDK